MKKSKKKEKMKDQMLEEFVFEEGSSPTERRLEKGTYSKLDLLAPAGIDLSDPEILRVDNRYVQNYVLTGFPRNIQVGWLDHLFNSEEDMDTIIHIEPTDERSALDELTNKITQFESQLSIELEKGNNRNITRLQNKIEELYSQREKIELNYINLFYIQIAFNLFSKTRDTLTKKAQLLDNILKGRKVKAMPTFMQQDLGYKTVLPLGKSFLPGLFRNFSSEALTACFPFYNAEISHKTGVYVGVNLATKTPIYIDFYDRHILTNGNLSVFGKAGSGKTFFVSLLTARSVLKKVRTVIVDPEGEYNKLTRALGGAVIDISPGSQYFINPFDIEEEDVTNEEGLPTGEKIVRVKDKVADLLNLIGVMAGGISNEEKSLVSYVLNDVYAERGITEDPESLYAGDAAYNEKTMELEHGGVKKEMPTFSDFYRLLQTKATKEGIVGLQKLVNTISMFKKGGVYDLFDCHTSEELRHFKEAPVVSFDISKLEESILRPIGMYIALSWTWEKFVKKNPLVKKRVVCDEAWMLMNKNMAGHEFTAQFLETAARRIRKRNGGLLVASQNFFEFSDNPQGKAVLSNTAAHIFLKQDSSDLASIQETFKLSDGERNFLYTASRGQFLLRLHGDSTVGFASSFDFERALIEKSYVSKD